MWVEYLSLHSRHGERLLKLLLQLKQLGSYLEGYFFGKHIMQNMFFFCSNTIQKTVICIIKDYVNWWYTDGTFCTVLRCTIAITNDIFSSNLINNITWIVTRFGDFKFITVSLLFLFFKSLIIKTFWVRNRLLIPKGPSWWKFLKRFSDLSYG